MFKLARLTAACVLCWGFVVIVNQDGQIPPVAGAIPPAIVKLLDDDDCPR